MAFFGRFSASPWGQVQGRTKDWAFAPLLANQKWKDLKNAN